MDLLSIQLSKRLKTLADYVPDGARFVDVGTDHAYIPIYLATTSNVKSLIATDVAKGPIESAKQNVQQYQLADRISIRLGNGLMPVMPGEVDTVLIAGMGGHTAVEILASSKKVVDSVHKLILQPMNASHLVRRYLDTNGFHLQTETVIEEDGRFYEMIVAGRILDIDQEQLQPDIAYEKFRFSQNILQFAYEFGPLLLNNPTSSFVSMMKQTRDKWINLRENIAKSDSSRAVMRQETVKTQIQIMDDWLKNVEERLADDEWNRTR
jgi:tRNA (adenine22-N1)-methyltransferase